MEIGTGIAVAGSISAITIPMATVIIAVVKRQEASRPTCLVHPSIEAAVARIERMLEKRSEDLWDAITTIQQDIKQLLAYKQGGGH